MTTLQKATAAANGYHGSAIRRCNEAKLIVEALDTHESHDGIAEVRKALHKVQEAGVAAEEAFAAVLLKVTRDEEVETWKDRAETVSNTTAEAAALCLRSIGVAEGKLRAAAAHAGQAAAAAAAVAPAATPGRLVEALKPNLLTIDATPIEVRQWKRKLVTYLRRSGVPNWQDVSDQHSVFFGCMESAVEDRVMHHDRYEDTAAVLPADPVPDGSSLVELLDEVYLEEVPLFNRRLEFFQMRQRTGEGETVEQFVELLEARAREAEVHLMSREDLIMFRCHTGIVEEGMLVEWRRLETPSLPEMKRAMTRYKAGKAQKKALKKDRERDARAARARDKDSGGGGGGGKKKRSPSRRRAVPPEWKELCLRCGNKGHMAADCSKRREDVNCDSCGRQGHTSKVCLTSYEEKKPSSPKKRDKTPGPSVRVTKEASQEPWMTEDESEGEADLVHLVRAAAGGHRSTPVLRAMIRQGTMRGVEVKCTPDTGATRTVVAADMVRRLGLATTASSARLYTAKAGERMECSRQASFHMRARTTDGRPGPLIVVEALVSKDLTDEVLVSWHDLIRLGVLSSTFPAVDVAQVRKVESADGLREELMGDFPDVLSDFLSKDMRVKGDPMSIRFKEGVSFSPFRVTRCRQVPLHMKDDADALLADLEMKGVLGRLECDETTENLFRGHFVPKPGGKGVRLVTDYTPINPYIERPVHPFPSPDIVFQSVGKDSKWFAKLDALHGYYQIPLAPESQKLTAFLLPQGRFYYRVAPMGLNPSGDWWCRKSDEAIAGLPGVLKLVDDILVHAPSLVELRGRIRGVLQRCRAHGIVLSKKKFEVGRSVHFAGHNVTDGGIKPDEERLGAISEFPTPHDTHQLRSFLGLANQLGNFLPDLAAGTVQMRGLLRKRTAWVWTPDHEKEFVAVKQLLTSAPVAHYFDPQLESKLLTDASRSGIGFALIQEGPDGHKRLITCGSRGLNSAEARYAPVELECLGVVYAIQKCAFYIMGAPKPFTVVTDHKPLLGVFNKPLSETPNPRLQRLRLKVVGANVRLTWEGGKHNLIADALSRAPVSAAAPLDAGEQQEEAVFVRALVEGNADAASWLYLEAQEDDDYQKLLGAHLGGTSVRNLPPDHPAHCYKGVWDQLSTTEGPAGRLLLVLDGARIVVPRRARRKILELLHRPHAGVVKTQQAARQLYYWPGMSAAVSDAVEKCELCAAALPSKPLASALAPTTASRPMQAVGLDLFHAGGRDYLVMVDRYSGYPFVQCLSSTTAAAVTRALAGWWELFGFPSVIRADGGPQFRCQEFLAFCNERDIELETSSPYNPRSNGLAEAAVKNCKKLLLKCISGGENYADALLEFRNCPRPDGFSPAQLMFGRRMRTALPAAAGAFEPIALEAAEEARKKTHEAALADIGTRRLDKFHEGDEVWVQNRITGVWDKDAIVLGQRNGGASFSIYFPESEKISWRNERFLRMKKSGGETPQSDEHRKIANSPPPLPTDRVSPSFDPHPLRRSERIRQKNKVNKLDGVIRRVRFAKEVTIFHFDPDDVVKCNFVFPDGRRQQHREEGGGAHHGRLHTDDGELVRVPRVRAAHAVDGDGHGDAVAGGRGVPRGAVVGPAATGQEAVAAGGFPRPGPTRLRDGLPVPRPAPLLGASARPVLDAWGGGRGPLRGAALGTAWPPLPPPAASFGPWAGPAVAPGG